MDSVSLSLGVLATVLTWVTYSAWRSGTEGRDVKLLGGIAAMLGAGTAVSALF